MTTAPPLMVGATIEVKARISVGGHGIPLPPKWLGKIGHSLGKIGKIRRYFPFIIFLYFSFIFFLIFPTLCFSLLF